MPETSPSSNAPEHSKIPPLTTRYRVSFKDVHRHLIAIEMIVPAPEGPVLDLIMPIWTPGSYLVREYSRHVHEVHVSGPGGELPVAKVSKNVWRVELGGGPKEISVRYVVYAFDLTVRTCYVDADSAFLTTAGLFFWADGRARLPHIVEIQLPDAWGQISTGLERVPGKASTFYATDFDELVDCPFLVGNHRVAEFSVAGVPHQMALSGVCDRPVESLVGDIQRIVETVVSMFGVVPYDHYAFLVHLTDIGYGGLEHHNSCALLLSRYAVTKEHSYQNRWLPLVAHEYFHVFNVKRIRPRAFADFDYTQEIYTHLLWVAEGITSYYDNLLVMRAGLITSRQLLDVFGNKIARLMRAPGRLVQTLEESSFDAWIKFYRADEESENSTVSYYLKGGLVTWLIDLELRRCTNDENSMDDVMRRLFADYQQDDYVGLRRAYLQEVVEDVAGQEMSRLFDDYVYGTKEIDFATPLEVFGLRVVPSWKRSQNDGPPSGGQVGIDVIEEAGKAIVSRVRVDTPAAREGLYVGDEIIAVDGHRCSTEAGLRERFTERTPDQQVTITLARRGIMREVSMVLDPWPPDRFTLMPVESPTATQLEHLRAWLGEDLSSIGL